MTGRRQGFCASGSGSPGRGFGRGAGRGAGHGRGNQFYATGLTGWQRAGQGDHQAAAPVGEAPGFYARLDEKLTEVLVRLERLESVRQD